MADKNTKPSPMTYEVVRMPNLRAQMRAAAASGEESVTLDEPEAQSVTITPKKGGK